MRGWILICVTVVLACSVCSEASAWGFRSRSVSTTRTVTTQRYASPQAACQAKAAAMAAMGVMKHMGGGFAGGSAEGVGRGATAAQASANCCFSGQLPVLGHAVAYGHGSYFACKIYAGGSKVAVRTRAVLRR